MLVYARIKNDSQEFNNPKFSIFDANFSINITLNCLI